MTYTIFLAVLDVFSLFGGKSNIVIRLTFKHKFALTNFEIILGWPAAGLMLRSTKGEVLIPLQFDKN